MENRRDFIKKASLLTGALSLSTILPGSIQRALAIDPELGTTFLDAEHIVFLMQENRSFDHAFGSLKLTSTMEILMDQSVFLGELFLSASLRTA